ncbi:hypothetical protein [Providencia hangzhouensis]|uniref:hypothetical protein n=1 Tax=Providencia hangzhouensis TaxID=3031799 RepID=UPI0034DD63B3
MKLNLSITLTSTLLIFSSFYLTKFGLSPVYFLLPCLFLSWFLLSISNDSNKITIDFILLISLLSIVILIFNNILRANEYTWPIIVNYIIAIICLLIGRDLIGKITRRDAVVAIHYYNLFVIAIVTIDTVFRFKYPIINDIFQSQGSDLWFYQYKRSFILGDSNVVSILLMTTIFFNIFFMKKMCVSIKYKSVIIVAFFILLFLTFSRAAYLATTIGIIYATVYSNIYRRFIFYIVGVILCLALIPYLINVVTHDGSGSTKLGELSNVINYYQNVDTIYNAFFGVGFGNGIYVMDMYIHGLFAKLLVEGGLMFFFAFTLLMYCIYKIERMVLILYVPLFIASISLSFYILSAFQGAVIGLVLFISKMSVKHNEL